MGLFRSKNKARSRRGQAAPASAADNRNTHRSPAEQLTPDGGLPFGWVGRHPDFHNRCMQIDAELRRKASQAESNRDYVTALKEALPVCEQYERMFSRQGACFGLYFRQIVTDGILDSIRRAEMYIDG